MAKINKRTAREIHALQESANANMIMAARKQLQDDTVPDWCDKSADYYAGMAQGKYAAISKLLMAHNKYRGYRANQIKVDHPHLGTVLSGLYELEDYYLPEEVWAVVEQDRQHERLHREAQEKRACNIACDYVINDVLAINELMMTHTIGKEK